MVQLFTFGQFTELWQFEAVKSLEVVPLGRGGPRGLVHEHLAALPGGTMSDDSPRVVGLFYFLGPTGLRDHVPGCPAEVARVGIRW